MKNKCIGCVHYARPTYEFPCSECIHLENGGSDMYVATESSIKDSGARREFETGAVRDIQEGKGRCDLMPLDIVGKYMDDLVLLSIGRFQETGDVVYLYTTLNHFERAIGKSQADLMLEVAVHFENGAKKYGERNWQKGLPVSCYIDSAVRHYLKFLRGDTDERHDRAFVWNILCCIWTIKHIEKGENANGENQ